MSGKLRVLIPGAVCHVISRGNFKIPAFVLMNNRYHFLLKTENANFPLIWRSKNYR